MPPRALLVLALHLGACGAGQRTSPAPAAVDHHAGSAGGDATGDADLARTAPELEAVRALAEPLWSLPIDDARLGRVCASASALREAAVALERAAAPLAQLPAPERSSAEAQARLEAWVLSTAFVTVAADRLATECPGVRPSDLDADLSSLRTSVATLIDIAHGGDGDPHHDHDHDHHAP
jgi:hypothetical protein